MDDPPELDAALLDLLVEWEDRRAAGGRVTPEELCRDCPDRLDDLRREIGRIARLDGIIPPPGPQPVAPPNIPGIELGEEIGRGGMGVVYRARQVALNRTVAVKVPFDSAGVAVLRERFRREAETLGQLVHPGIVRVFAGDMEGDTPYLVMEYVAGGSLAERMPAAADTPGRAAALVERVARAVDHAHAAGIVHRDLKPSNILLDEDGHPRVSDFGVAALLAGEPLTRPADDTPVDDPAGRTRVTRTGWAVGTRGYAAPESAAAPPAPAADVWSLGVVLYECLTGRLPYPADGPAAPGLPPPRPGAVRPGVPRGLEAVALRCLALDPAARYPTAGAVADDLARWARRQRLRRGAARLALVAVVVGLAVAIAWPKSPEARHADVARTLTSEFDRDGRVDLVPATGMPATHLVRVNADVARTGLTAEEVFFAECPRPCLVELLPDVPCDHYEFSAMVRQVSGISISGVGLYCGHAEVADGPAPGHRFVCLSFADVGLEAFNYPGPNGQKGSALSLAGVRYRPISLTDSEWMASEAGWAWYPSSVQGTGPGPWRRVSLIVSPDELRGNCGNLVIPPAPAETIGRTVRGPRYPRGGLGVYLNGAGVQVQNCRLERRTRHP